MSEQEVDQGIVIRHPFRIEHIFFLKVQIERPERAPTKQDGQNLITEFALGLPDNGERYNLNLRVRSQPDVRDELGLEILAVGVFEYLEEGKPSAAEMAAFFNEHLLIAMTSRVIQLVAALTTQMGIRPVWLPSPRGFGLDADIVQEMIKTFQLELDLNEA
jgi:hypothetical protein